MSTHHTRDQRAAAARFFRRWLIGAVIFSTAGNVTHALLNPDAASSLIAACIAVVAPVAQLGMTYGVHMLVQCGIVGAAYRAALRITVALVVVAFALSFYALCDLAVHWAGMPLLLALLVPLAIDLGITGCTMALLAITDAQRTEQLAQPPAPVHADAPPAAQAPEPVHAAERPAAPPPAPALSSVRAAEHPAHSPVHAIAAQRIVAQGAVRIAPERVAAVLAERAEGTAPSMIARKHGVGYDTVKSILSHPAAQSSIDQSAAA
ncbi:hypothetical protein [Mycolicibacterium wolinskyi]|uniref:hypothetical protein n=1 Tax=Mycolicibacterium wolinskyi TaxID=59750 RepID=UPI0039176C91